jgi:hypothetical protein
MIGEMMSWMAGLFWLWSLIGLLIVVLLVVVIVKLLSRGQL